MKLDSPGRPPKTSPWGVISFLLFLITFLLPCGPPVSAQPESPVQLTVGIKGKHAGGWTPVTIRIGPELAKKAPLEVELTLLQHQGEGLKELAVHSKSVPANDAGAAVEVKIPVQMSGPHLIRVRVLSEGWTLFKKEVAPIPSEKTVFVLVLTTDPKKKLISPLIGLENQVETISLAADELDGDWIYYDSVSRIVVDGVDLETLTNAQFEAIRSWVHGGGLILFTSAGLELNAGGPRFASLADFRIKGKKRIESPSGVAEFFQEEPDLIARIDALDVEAQEQDIFLSARSAPIILRHEVGLGTVWAFAFDPEAIALNNLKRYDPLLRKIWTSALRFTARPSGSAWYWEEPIATTPEAKTENLLKPFSIYLGIMVLLLGPINTFLLRRLDKREYILATIPAVTFLFVVFAFVVGLFLKGDKATTVARSVTIGKAGDTLMTQRQSLGVMAPRSGLYTLALSNSAGPNPKFAEREFLPGYSWPDRYPSRTQYYADNMDLSNIEIPMWGMKFFELSSMVDHDKGISVDWDLEGETLAGSITSGLPFELKQCYLIFGFNKLSLGTLNPDEPREFEFKILPASAHANIRLGYREKASALYDIFHPYFWKKTSLDDSQLKFLAYNNRINPQEFEGPVLTGWTETPSPLHATVVEEEETRIASQLFIFRLPLYFDKKNIEVPLGFAGNGRFLEAAAAGRFLSVYPNSPGIRELDLPFNAHEDFEVDELSVHMSRIDLGARKNSKAEESQVELSIYDWEKNEWTKLLNTSQKNVLHKVDDNPGRYVRLPHGFIRLKAEIPVEEDAYSYPGQYGYMDIYDYQGAGGCAPNWGEALWYLDASMKGHFPGKAEKT